MSFLPAVQREIARRNINDEVRVTLEYLLANGVGHRNAKTLETIVDHLQTRGLAMNNTQFQQGVLAHSRSADYFIGSGRHGYFLIDTIDDAIVMRDFYETRIASEQQNLANLRAQSAAIPQNWNI